MLILPILLLNLTLALTISKFKIVNVLFRIILLLHFKVLTFCQERFTLSASFIQKRLKRLFLQFLLELKVLLRPLIVQDFVFS